MTGLLREHGQDRPVHRARRDPPFDRRALRFVQLALGRGETQ
jgi:hypothetical protein